jgi:serine/threonine protein kinase
VLTPVCAPALQLENALLQGDPDSNTVQLKLCDFGYSKDELVRWAPFNTTVQRMALHQSVTIVGRVTVADMSLLMLRSSVTQSESLCKTLCGTPEYIAPEVGTCPAAHQ